VGPPCRAAGDTRATALIGFLDTEPLSRLPHDFELIAPDGLTAVDNLDISLANVQAANLERRLDDLRAGSTGFSASGFITSMAAPPALAALAWPGLAAGRAREGRRS
jgi:hypothetical protein